jgi:drug/metabolite transporter (DMT)-like permease
MEVTMWMVYAILTFFLWGIADLFYKKGNIDNDKYTHLKTGIMVGLVMGIHAIIYFFVKGMKFDIMAMLKYLPVSVCYITSMIIGYKGLKYINLSISSPIQNSSGLITSLLLAIIFSVKLSIYEIVCLVIMAIGVIMLSVIENKKDIKVTLKKITVAAIVFPLIYCLIDGLGTFLDAVYLDHLELIDEDMALISYEFTFLLYGIISYIILRAKKVKIRLKEEKTRLSAAIFETLGQFTYVFAITSHSVITAPIVACYSALSVLLSRIFLKEKISKLQYVALFLIFSAIIGLAILEEA